MNRMIWAIGGIALVAAGSASAACDPGKRLNSAAAITTHLSDKTVCGTAADPNSSDKWQEFHESGGRLVEYARGANDPVDPTRNVGTWSTSGENENAVVIYSYTGGGSYSFNVHVDDGTTEFCSGGTRVATAFLLANQVACQP